MNENNTQYYFIRDTLLGKKENGRYWLFTQGKWEHDTNNIIMDTIWGFDPSEPSDSPYAFCGPDMDDIESISEEQAEAIIRKRAEKGTH